LTCIALDDEPLALQLLENYILRTAMLQPLGFFTDPDLAAARLAQGGIDLLFLDIQMPDMNGLEFLKYRTPPPLVVLTTAYAEFAVEGFNLDAIDYLLKPFSFARFSKAVEKATDRHTFLKMPAIQAVPAGLDTLFVKSGYQMISVAMDRIIAMEGFDDYVKIHLTGQVNPVLTKRSLKSLLAVLPPDKFIQVHRSFIVARDKIVSWRRSSIRMPGNRLVPIGKKYERALIIGEMK
jgi:DNA-binding LytR/AlgR family response regulator